jgi:hypothetical protein
MKNHMQRQFCNVRHWSRKFVDAVFLVAIQILICSVLMAPVQEAVAQTTYTEMAPISKYLPESAADEVEVARSAAPAAIADQAEILTFGPDGYTVAVKGTNGFVCLVERSWNHRFKSLQFWNPDHRTPICYSPEAASSVLLIYLERTKWVLAHMSIAEMVKRTQTEMAENTMHLPTRGVVMYMLSKHQYICSSSPLGCGRWYPHVMFSFPNTNLPNWGANLNGMPVFSAPAMDGITNYFVLVPKWSDQTPSPAAVK